MPVRGRKIVSSFVLKLTVNGQYFDIGDVFEYENEKTGISTTLKVVESENNDTVLSSDCRKCYLNNLCANGIKPSCTDLRRIDHKNVYFKEI